MRQSLMGSFDQLYVLDLHGNSKKKERSPDGSPDENVFDIQQGVAIGIFVKRGSSGGSSVVSRSDMWGDRESKYERLLEESVATTEWETIEPQAPMYLFASHDTEFEEEYESGWHLRRMMPFYSPGIITARDGFVIDVSRDQLEQRMGEFADLSIDDGAIRAKYFTGKGSPKYLPGDTRGWKLVDARRKVSADDFRASRFRECLYRPFDVRWVYYSPDMVDWPRQDATAHMLAGPNRALIATRQTKDHWGTHVSSEIVCHKSFAAYDINDFFPLYLYPMGGHEGSASVNLSDEFVAAAASALGQQFVSSGTGDLSSTFGPNDVFHYMYAVFHSDTYGRRYSSFLKTDFPRLPLTTNGVLFRELCGLGAHLVALHLMEREPKLITTYPRTGDNRVERVHYDSHAQGEQSRVWINQTQYFAGVLPELWNCHVGGFQVCERWLKDRKGRMLNYHDLTHYQRIVSTLAETNQLTRRIDEVIDERGGWPIR
jgi:predicted helicase